MSVESALANRQDVRVRVKLVALWPLAFAVATVGGCSPSRSAHGAPSVSSSRSPKVSFCDLYRRDAGDGQLRNWDLNDNPKTLSYTDTLRALADAAPSTLKPDIARILTYYSNPSPPRPSMSEYKAQLESGERVLAYVEHTCAVDTSGSPPGDTSSPTSR
jgi:hypothetical protein